MSLIVEKIKCVEESDEIGADDIYLIVFQGRTVSPFTSGLASIGPGNVWSDFDSGETHVGNATLAHTHSDALNMVMMVEKDSGKDIAGSEVLGLWKAQSDLTWKSLMLSMVAGGIPTNTESAKNSAFSGMRNTLNGLASIYMEFPKGDDDIINVERITITKPGESQVIRFRSDSEDATYDVTFRQTAA